MQCRVLVFVVIGFGSLFGVDTSCRRLVDKSSQPSIVCIVSITITNTGVVISGSSIIIIILLIILVLITIITRISIIIVIIALIIILIIIFIIIMLVIFLIIIIQSFRMESHTPNCLRALKSRAPSQSSQSRGK